MILLPWNKLKNRRHEFSLSRKNLFVSDLDFASSICENNHNLVQYAILIRHLLAREFGVNASLIFPYDPTSIYLSLIGSDHCVGYWFSARKIDLEFFSSIVVEINENTNRKVYWNWEEVAVKYPFVKTSGNGDVILGDWVLNVSRELELICSNLSVVRDTIEKIRER